jgi:hypothetical protein
MMSVEQSVERQLAGETEVIGENLPQCHFVHHKSHMNSPGIETRPPRWIQITKTVFTLFVYIALVLLIL